MSKSIKLNGFDYQVLADRIGEDCYMNPNYYFKNGKRRKAYIKSAEKLLKAGYIEIKNNVQVPSKIGCIADLEIRGFDIGFDVDKLIEWTKKESGLELDFWHTYKQVCGYRYFPCDELRVIILLYKKNQLKDERSF